MSRWFFASFFPRYSRLVSAERICTRSSGMSSHVVLTIRSGLVVEIALISMIRNETNVRVKKESNEENHFDEKKITVSIHGLGAWHRCMDWSDIKLFVNKFTRQLKPECVMYRLRGCRSATTDSASAMRKRWRRIRRVDTGTDTDTITK